MKIIKDKKLYVFLIVTIAFFATLALMSYSVDTYLLLASPKMEYIREYLSSGRIFTTLFFFILSVFKTPAYGMYLLSYILGVICCTLSIYELNKMLDNYVKNKIVSILLSIFIIINPFTIELWLFIEMGIMMLSVLAIVKAFKHFNNYLDKKSKKEFIYSLVWMLVSLFSYQGPAALFIALSIIPILYKSKGIKNVAINSIKMVSIYLIPSIINYLFILLFSTKRIGGGLSIESIIQNVVNTTRALFQGFGLYPRGLTLFMLLGTLVITIIYIVKAKDRLIATLNIVYIVLMIYLFTLAPIIIQTSDRVAIYPRTCYAFYTFVGVILVISNKKVKSILPIILIGFILLNELLVFNIIGINRHKVNENDKEIIMKIEENVKEYEKINQVKVTKLAIYNKDKCHIFYEGKLNDNINVSAIKEEPSGLAAYTYYTQRRLEYTEGIDSIYNEYFSNIKDNQFDLSQVIIDRDTIHWYLY